MGHGGPKSKHISLVRTTACFCTHTPPTLCFDNTSQMMPEVVISVYSVVHTVLAAAGAHKHATPHSTARVGLNRNIAMRSACCKALHGVRTAAAAAARRDKGKCAVG